MEVKRDRKNQGPYIITICGPLRFTREMLMAHHNLSMQGFMVFMPDINLEEPIPKGSSPFNEEAQTLHDAKISFGDAVFIMNADDYIGESTFKEFDLARRLGKDIIWYSHDGDNIHAPSDETRQLLIKLDKEMKKK